MKVLVTGASGFIGSHLAEKLAQRGDEVFCLVRRTSDISFLKTLPVKLIYGDLDDINSLRQAVKDKEMIYHPAGVIKTRHREDYYRANQGGTRNLLEAIIITGTRLRRFVYVSSQAACGPSPDGKPLSEADSCKPITDYGRSKLAGEEVVRSICCPNYIPYTIIRPPSVFGPRDKEILFFFRQAKKGKIPVIGKDEKYFSLIYVKDLVEGIILAGESEKSIGETYFIAYPQALTWQNIADLFSRIFQRICGLRYIPVSVAYIFALASEFFSHITARNTIISRDKILELSQKYWICSADKIKNQLGFTPRTPLETAIRETADWYKAHGWL
ncbi:MAG: NAD-dependent epimerase/dehydratase family protein [Candidatus Sumerlaeia bacterium]|nr:NAD-dependent epimerase/dehydratase family protein [Candidatus Sumerlaeia bacterium]